MAITIGGVSTALVGFQGEKNGGAPPPPAGLLADQPQCRERGGRRGAGHESGPITPATTDLITVLLTPVAVLMVIYALFCFYWRSVFMRKKQARRPGCLAAAPRPAAGALTADARAQMGFYNDYWGPAILCGLVMLVLTVIMVVGLVEVLWY